MTEQQQPNKQTPSTTNRPTTFADFLKVAKFEDVIPSFMKERSKEFVRLALNDIPKNPQLATIAQNAPRKVVVALMDCARLGLMPGPLGHVYLVPFGEEVQVIIGYKGLIDLARRSGDVARVEADVIYSEDAFEYVKGDRPAFIHKPNLASKKRKQEDIVAAYAFAYDRNGNNLGGAVMPKEDVDAIRGRSKTGGGRSSPWSTDYAEMAKKTAIRRASKLWPVSTDFHEALDTEDRHEAAINTVQPASARIEEKGAPPLVDSSLYGESDQGAQDLGDGVTMTAPPRE